MVIIIYLHIEHIFLYRSAFSYGANIDTLYKNHSSKPNEINPLALSVQKGKYNRKARSKYKLYTNNEVL